MNASLPELPDDLLVCEIMSGYIVNEIVPLTLTCRTLHSRLQRQLHEHRLRCLLKGCRFVGSLEKSGPDGNNRSFERCYLEALLDVQTIPHENQRLFRFERELRLEAFRRELSSGVFSTSKLYSLCDIRQVMIGHPMAPFVISALMERNNDQLLDDNGRCLVLELAAASGETAMFSKLLHQSSYDAMTSTGAVGTSHDAPTNLARVMYQAARSCNPTAIRELALHGVDANGCAAQLLLDGDLIGLLVLWQCQVPLTFQATFASLMGSIIGSVGKGFAHFGMSDAIRTSISESYTAQI